ncbi:SsrA-binding protein SmpB [Patescibacteria group bacterium]|nr:SsrA-binding protein SmpB [Patescibacteria group bacterium]
MPTLALNRKARFDYECLEKIEAGLVLTGQEVKSVREGGAKIDTGHIIAHQGNLFMIGANIAPYKKASSHLEHDPARSRQLLIHKKQLLYLLGKIGEKGLTLIPISLYTRGNRIKLEFWLARGKKAHEKRQKIKDRDIQRETDRYIRGQD